MKLKTICEAALISLSFTTVASAAVVALDPFQTAETATTTGSSSSVTRTQTPSDLHSAFGERDLTATRIFGFGQVTASIGEGIFGCERPFAAASCTTSYKIGNYLTLSSVSFSGFSNGAPFGFGIGSIEFYLNSDLIGNQILGPGTGSYSVMFANNANFVSGDDFSVVLRGTPGNDLWMSDFRGNVVPEPTSWALASFGLLGLGFTRRRRGRLIE